jgi:hypothetical protein
VVFELRRVEVPRLLLYDMLRKIEHVLSDLNVLDIIEILGGIADSYG